MRVRFFTSTCFSIILSIAIIGGTGCSRCGKARYLKIWDIAYKEGQYEKAITKFQKFVKDCSKGEWTTYARLQIGDCFLNLKDEGQARKYFKEVVQLNWHKCTTKQALGCLEHLDSDHEKPYPLHLSGKCPLCRK
jgi:tetratricopeptide (TPR) repeat protein